MADLRLTGKELGKLFSEYGRVYHEYLRSRRDTPEDDSLMRRLVRIEIDSSDAVDAMWAEIDRLKSVVESLSGVPVEPKP